jgi:succinate-acetate transporter protein
MEFISGNTVRAHRFPNGFYLFTKIIQFGATVFPAYGAFNLSYAMIYLPGSGILVAYTDSSGTLSPRMFVYKVRTVVTEVVDYDPQRL